MSISAEIERWMKSPEGKTKVELARKEALAAGKPFGQARTSMMRPTEYYAAAMRDILKSKILSIRSEATKESYLDHIIYKVFDDGAGVYFDPAYMARPSLDPDNFPRGIENIAILINNGYRASGAVHGTDRHGTERWSLASRRGLNFMQAATDEFNRRFEGKAHAELDIKYR